MQNKLYRSRKFRVFGGVAGGLAEYFHLDVILVRILFIIITLFSGLGILFYIVLWIVVPEEPFDMAYGFKMPQGEPASPPESSTGSSAEGEKAGENIFGSPDFTVPPPAAKNTGRVTAGAILIIIGVLFLADKIFPYFDFSDILPVALIGIGGILIWNSIRK